MPEPFQTKSILCTLANGKKCTVCPGCARIYPNPPKIDPKMRPTRTQQQSGWPVESFVILFVIVLLLDLANVVPIRNLLARDPSMQVQTLLLQKSGGRCWNAAAVVVVVFEAVVVDGRSRVIGNRSTDGEIRRRHHQQQTGGMIRLDRCAIHCRIKMSIWWIPKRRLLLHEPHSILLLFIVVVGWGDPGSGGRIGNPS